MAKKKSHDENGDNGTSRKRNKYHKPRPPHVKDRLGDTCHRLELLEKNRVRTMGRAQKIVQPSVSHFMSAIHANLRASGVPDDDKRMTFPALYGRAKRVRSAAYNLLRPEWVLGTAEESREEFMAAFRTEEQKRVSGERGRGAAKKDPLTEEDFQATSQLLAYLLSDKGALMQLRPLIKAAEDLMIEAARELPVHDWWCSFRGLNSLGLAQVVGEAGDLRRYDRPGKVWKRLGLHAIVREDGTTRAGSTWMRLGGLSVEEWAKAGYVPSRRSVVFVIGSSVIMARNATKGDARYVAYYDQEKERSKQFRSDDRKKPIHHHRHAQRLMEKRIIRDLWIQWNPDLVEPQNFAEASA